MTHPTREKLRELLVYEPDTGHFRYRTGPRAGQIAGHPSHGYIKISIPGHGGLYAHRLAWLYMTGEMPPDLMDHIDCVRDNNAWSNLRLATPSQNAANARIKRGNTSGFKGVRLIRGQFRAKITVGCRIVYLGDYETLEEAVAAYKGAARVGFGEYARAG